MMLNDVKDYVSSLGLAEHVYMGKMDSKLDRSVGVYNSKNGRVYKTAIGGPHMSSYGTKQVTILIHWNRSPRETERAAKELFEKANDILGYRITDIMFNGTDEDLRQTKVTQPAVFLHSVISALCMGDDFKPEMTAGHPRGEFPPLVAAGALSFEDGLKLVYARAMAMQKACEAQPSTMAAIIALPDEKVEEICEAISKEGEVVVAANYNCPGQIVISGSIEGINKACEQMKAAGAKRALPLKVGGAFHSPLMNPAKVELEAAINATEIHTPKCPVYQNVDALPHTDPAEIKANLVAQLTASVRWTQTVKNMVADGADDFTECGPGAVLQGLIKKIDGSVNAHGIA